MAGIALSYESGFYVLFIIINTQGQFYSRVSTGRRGGFGTGDTGDWTPVDFQQWVTVTRPEMTQSDKFIKSTLNKNRKKGWRSDFGVKSNI